MSSPDEKPLHDKVCTFIKKKSKARGNVRKRKGSSSEEDNQEKSAVVTVERKQKKNLMIQKSGRLVAGINVHQSSVFHQSCVLFFQKFLLKIAVRPGE